MHAIEGTESIRAQRSRARDAASASRCSWRCSCSRRTRCMGANCGRTVRSVPVGGTFNQPIFVTAPTGDRAALRRRATGNDSHTRREPKRAATPFLDITAKVGTTGEAGLLGMAFSPTYADRRRQFYVYYLNQAGDSVLSRFLRSASNPERREHDRARDPHRRSAGRSHQSQGRHDRVLADRRHALLGARRRRRRRRSRQPRAESPVAARQDAAHRRERRPDQRLHDSRRQSVRVAQRTACSTRSGRSASAIRSAGASTASSATSGSATSARARARRSTSRSRPIPAVATTAGR